MVLGSIAGGQLKSRAAWGELLVIFGWSFGVGFWPALVGARSCLFVLTRVQRPLSDNKEKGKTWTHGIERLPQGKDVDSVAICAQQALSLLPRPPQTPAIHPISCAAPQKIIDSFAVHAVHSEGVTWLITLVYGFLYRMAAFAPQYICLSCFLAIPTPTCSRLKAASGGTAFSPFGVVVRCVLQIAKRRPARSVSALPDRNLLCGCSP